MSGDTFRFTTDPHILAASVSANVLGFALPLMMLQIYDRVIPHKGYETLTVLTVGVMVAIVLEMVLRAARAHLMALAGDAFERNTQARLFERLLKTELSTVEKHSPGVYMDQISSIDRIREFRHGDTAVAALDLPFAALFLLVVMVISPILAAVIVLLTLVSVFAVRALQSQAATLSQQRRGIDRRRFSFLIEVLDGIESIKSLNLEAFMERRYERLSSSTSQVGAQSTRRSNFSQTVTGSIGQITPVLIASVGAVMVINQAITIGGLAAVMLLGSRIVQPVLKLEALRVGEEDTRRAESELAKLMAFPLPAKGGTRCERIDSIELSGINLMRQDTDTALFSNLDLKLNRGEIISIDGANGSGRSMLLWMIMGYCRPQSGGVRINGAPMDVYDQADLRGRIAYLPPRPMLLEGTVLDNMSRFQPERHLDDALRVATALGLGGYFASHQEGFSAVVGHGLNAGLPTSVAERVPLVGALVGRPDLVLFDEANANLDMEGDACLKEYIAALKGQAAVILVTQRPSYVALADRHFLLADGQLSQVARARQPQTSMATSL
ncbi:ATP-binding cassette subfamily C protein LapB [Hoeflea marina]|uniref:ATP-binding cassette subfamily C protein LapB n=1 Tax=Hoeflea marina TaxID=274592 RepID=A0A317PQF0_9HYPH|nr:ABC transporter transmembrane domain-containing protein [Hoeflea marina]PWW00621.1 ATP-binding cassette subfamily C protein LapB [Hoeflea marina]